MSFRLFTLSISEPVLYYFCWSKEVEGVPERLLEDGGLLTALQTSD